MAVLDEKNDKNRGLSENIKTVKPISIDHIFELFSKQELDKYLGGLDDGNFDEQLLNKLRESGYYDLIAKYLPKFHLSNELRKSLAGEMLDKGEVESVAGYLDNFVGDPKDGGDPVYYINLIYDRVGIGFPRGSSVLKYIVNHMDDLKGKLKKEIGVDCFGYMRNLNENFNLGVLECFIDLSFSDIDYIFDLGNINIIRKTRKTFLSSNSKRPFFGVDDSEIFIKHGLGDLLILNPDCFTINDDIISLLIGAKIVGWYVNPENIRKYEGPYKGIHAYNAEFLKSDRIIGLWQKNNGNQEDKFDIKFRSGIKNRLKEYETEGTNNYGGLGFYHIFVTIFDEFVEVIDQDWLIYLVGCENGRRYISNFYHSKIKDKDLDLYSAIIDSLNNFGYKGQLSNLDYRSIRSSINDDKTKYKNLMLLYIEKARGIIGHNLEGIIYHLYNSKLNNDPEIINKLVQNGFLGVIVSDNDTFKDVKFDEKLMLLRLDSIFGPKSISYSREKEFFRFRNKFEGLYEKMLNRLMELGKIDLVLRFIKDNYNIVTQNIEQKLVDLGREDELNEAKFYYEALHNNKS